MAKTPVHLKEEASAPPTFRQKRLAPINPETHRIVRCAGLKFILPNVWKAGDVLDAEAAAFLNIAHHTAVLNRFGATREELLSKPETTYDDLDSALQAFFEDYRHTPRPASAPTENELLTDHEKDLIAFARPFFNAKFGGKGLDRKDYEKRLREYVLANQASLSKALAEERAAMKALIDGLEDLNG